MAEPAYEVDPVGALVPFTAEELRWLAGQYRNRKAMSCPHAIAGEHSHELVTGMTFEEEENVFRLMIHCEGCRRYGVVEVSGNGENKEE